MAKRDTHIALATEKDGTLDEAIAVQGRNDRQPDLVTAEEVVAAEEKRVNGKPAAPAAAAPEETIDTEGEPGEINLDTLQAKIDNDEELSEEEAEFLKNIDKKLEVGTEEEDALRAAKTYVVNGETITYDEAVEMLREETTLGNVKIKAKALEKLVDLHIESKNRGVAGKKIAEGQRENAAERQKNTEERVRLQGERKALQRREQTVKRQLEEVNALLKIDMTEADIYEDGALDPKKHRTYLKIEDAREKLPGLQEEANELADEIKESNAAMLHNEIAVLISIAPQYALSEPFQTVASKMAKDMTVDPLDRKKMREIFKLIDARRAYGGTIEEAYEDARDAGTLAVKPTAAHAAGGTKSGKPGVQLPRVPEGKDLLKEKIAALRKKAGRANVSIGAGAGIADRGTEKKRQSTHLVEIGRKITGVQDKSPILTELGYK